MAEGDPKIGLKDAYRGDLITSCTTDEETPTLYHFKESYFSQIARLVLAEKQVKWNSRSLFIHGSELPHFAPWYVAISPDVCVPTLIDRGKPVPDSRRILYYVEEHYNTDICLYPEPLRPKIDSLVDLHFSDGAYPVGEHSLSKIESYSIGYLTSRSKFFRKKLVDELTMSIPKLEKYKEENPHLSAVYDKRISFNKARIELYSQPEALFEKGKENVFYTLKELNKAIEESEGQFLCGETYSLADVVFTTFFARINLVTGDVTELLENYLKLAAWWDMVKARESYKQADVYGKLDFIKSTLLAVTSVCTIL